MSKILSPYGHEPSPFTYETDEYNAKLAIAFNWYNQEKEKKDARSYLRHFVTNSISKDAGKLLDRATDSEIINTWGWVARMVSNGTILRQNHQEDFKRYLNKLLAKEPEIPAEKVEEEKVTRPSVRDNMEEKVNEYITELECSLDRFITLGEELELYKDLQYRQIPAPYCSYINDWLQGKAGEYISVYESNDDQIKEGYSNLGKRKLTQLIKLTSNWLEDLDRYSQFKKANRKPRAKKAKSPAQQVAKLKYMKEFTELKLKSVNPTEIVGASQVWIYNTKYRKLTAYRTDSASGIQIKGTSLQNYDPDLCEQKALRKPAEICKVVLDAGKVQLRKILSELSTKDTKVTGRISEECIILRVIR